MSRVFITFRFALFFISFSLVCFTPGFAQESFESELKNSSPKQKIIAYNQAADSLEAQSNTINLIYYYTTQAMALLENYHDNEQLAQAYYHLARVDFQLGRFELALADANTALSNTTNTESEYKILSLLGNIYEEQKAYSEALTTYKKLKKFKKGNRLKLLINETGVLINLNRLKQAKTTAEEALTLSRKEGRPEEILVLVDLGSISARNSRPDEALAFFKQAVSKADLVQINKFSTIAYFSLAKYLKNLGNYRESIFYGQKALLSNRHFPLNPLDSEIYALLYDDFLAIDETTQSISMLKLQYENELNLIKEKQSLNESFFDDSIKIQRLQNQISTLTSNNEQLIIFLSILFFLLLALLITIVFILNELRQRDSHLHAALVAYNSLKVRTDHLQQGAVQNHLLLEKMRDNNVGTLIGLIENYKDLRRQFGDVAVEYCCSEVSQTLVDVIKDAKLMPRTGGLHTLCIEWPANSYQDFCEHLQRIPGPQFIHDLKWQRNEIKVMVKISAYYQARGEENNMSYRWNPVERLPEKTRN